MEDSRIIELFFERSEQAITELSDKYGRIFLKVADNILNDRQDSEECVNDAYLGVWNAIPPHKPDSLPGYVCRIVRNIAVKRYHEKTAQKRNSIYDVAIDEIAGCIPSSYSVENEVSARETAAKIDAFLERLDSQSRIMFVRRYWHSDSIEDLAALFHRSRHYISVRLSRIRKELKQYLEGEGISL